MTFHELSPYVGEIVKVTWLDHFGVKQDWDEEFLLQPAINMSVGWLITVDDTCALVRPHRAEGPDKTEGSCGDMILVIAAITECVSLQPVRE